MDRAYTAVEINAMYQEACASERKSLKGKPESVVGVSEADEN